MTSNLEAVMGYRYGRATDGGRSSCGDPEIARMNAEAPLLDLIRRDTGEDGRERGNRIDFRTCPVCGHTDCFRFYPDSNSWTCFSESNASGYDGGTYVEYQKAVHGCDDAEAVKVLREATGNTIETPKPNGASAGEPCSLPSWRQVRIVDPPARNPTLIPGILRRGHVAVMSGKGKVGKTQSAIQLALAVAMGGEWFGLRIPDGGKVLHLDPECDAKSLDNRYSRACEAMGIDKAATVGRVFQWPLRGVEDVTIDRVLRKLEAGSSYGEFALIIIDSASVFVSGDENSSVDVRRFSAKVMQIAKVTGAAIWCVHHFGKARDGDRSASDRARGSSVWLDFPDAALTLTETFPPNDDSNGLGASECGMILESGGLREFPRMEPVRLIFDGTTHRVDAEGLTADWKAYSSQQAGGKATGELNKVRSERDYAVMESELMRMFLNGQDDNGGIAVKDVSDVVGVRSDRLTERITDRSEQFEIEKRGNRNYIVLRDAPLRLDT